ncbi:MAG: 8-amino-7-oxononanoate synthase [Betaproteobacteria bacterium]|nr:8-amino-7-oxononanoate synthase [Betaproteobacteria bacterium]
MNLREELDRRHADGLLRRRLTLEGAQGPHVRVAGRDYLAFASNDYLGLANHPALAEAVAQGAQRYGVGAGASHLIVGHGRAHDTLEQELADFVGLPRALLFSTGYMANLGVVSALVGRHDEVFADKLNHASLNDAVVLSRARMRRYPHGDVRILGRLLAESAAPRKLVVTDGVFSMDGDVAPLKELLALCERHGAFLLVDDAHGFGVLGARGRGILSHFALASPSIIYMATLGKAIGVAGAFVAGHPDCVEILIQRARPYVYTTAFPPLLAAAVSASLAIVQEDEWRRDHLATLIRRLRQGLASGRWRLSPSTTPIQPLLVGGNQEALDLSEALRAQGLLVPAIRPPTVPRDSARLRISLSAAHTLKDIERLVDVLCALS